jgi:hypothetical protein
MPSKLFDMFRAGELADDDIDDFEAILGSHFQNTAYFPRQTIFQLPDERPVLELLYTKRGRIADIVSREGIDPKTVDEIQHHVERDLFGDVQWRVSRTIVFAWKPIRGAYRRGNQWQLMPVPAGAPQPDQLYAPHPAVFEVRFRDASDVWTRAARHRRAEDRALTALNGLLNFRLRPDRHNGQSEWVIGNDPPHHVSVLKQVGYFYDPGILDNTFTNIDGLEIIKGGNGYYDQYGIGANEEFELPADLAIMLDRFDGLDPGAQGQFLRASYWAAHADFVRMLSKSASMIAAISSVEALAIPKEQRTLASGEVSGSTKAFNDVITRTLGKEYLKQHDLYDVRSDLAHGSRLFLGDAGGMMWRGVRSRAEDQAIQFVQRVLPVILHNWLVLEGA